MNKVLSIILPIYNVEDYLDDCLLSLIDQHMNENEYEIICVDDGSTDKSAEIVQRFQLKYSNIFLYQKENGGVGSARNYGLSRATGDYITFVDPDDYLTSGALNSVFQIIKETQSELCQFKYNCVDEEAHWRKESGTLQLTYEMKTMTSALAPRGMPGLIIERKLIDQCGIRFNDKLRNREDYIFNLLLFSVLNGKKMVVINEKIYTYRIRQNSLTYSKSTVSEIFQVERMQNMIVYVEECSQYLECHKECSTITKKEIKSIAAYYTATALFASLRCKTVKQNEIKKYLIQHGGVYPFPMNEIKNAETAIKALITAPGLFELFSLCKLFSRNTRTE